jgi:hypothetical protein
VLDEKRGKKKKEKEKKKQSIIHPLGGVESNVYSKIILL